MDCSTGGDVAPKTQTPGPSPELFGVEGGEGPANDAYWRSEVAARLERYRSRRKTRAPRYPTLRLPFDSADNSFSGGAAVTCAATAISPASRQTVAWHEEIFEKNQAESSRATDSLPLAVETLAAEPEARAAIEYESNVIEFPRSAVIPAFRGDELAEPVFDRPRIVEAPEVIPSPPALGGMLIEPAPTHHVDKRTITDFAQQPASLARRLAASVLDILILSAALGGFAALFLRINPARLATPLAAAGLLLTSGLLWLAYEFLFVVYTGSTPGWRMARLRLAKFDGSPVRRNLRRWRVLASFLSAFSLGLGYLWSLLDEEGLCWHDRITHTYLFSSNPGN
jgi:uncharacterized RDD family membrane protein YckC